MLGYDDAFTFELQVGAFHRDHAHLQLHSKRAYRGNTFPWLPLPNCHLLPDLLHDLEIHRPAIGLRNDDRAAHLYILSIHRSPMLSIDKVGEDSDRVAGFSVSGRPRHSLSALAILTSMERGRF